MKKQTKIILFILIPLLVLTTLFIYKKNKEKDFDKFLLVEEVNKEESGEVKYQEQISSLQKEYNNEDIVGILEIENTNYKVPIVQGNDNSFYLKHLPNKEYSIMGSIFLDYRVNINASRKLLIFGHNSSVYEMPFKILENYYDIDYINNHRYVYVKTKENIRKYEIFSLYIAINDYKYMNVNFNEETYQEHVKYLKEKSMYEINTEMSNSDNILILQTCSTHKDYVKYKKKYLVVAFHEINVNENVK